MVVAETDVYATIGERSCPCMHRWREDDSCVGACGYTKKGVPKKRSRIKCCGQVECLIWAWLDGQRSKKIEFLEGRDLHMWQLARLLE